MIRFNTTDLVMEFFNGTDWIPAGNYGIPTLSKGSIITSTGLANGEFLACADGEILEYDSAQTSGLICGAKTVDTDTDTNTNGQTECTGLQYLAGDGTCRTPDSGTSVGVLQSFSSGTINNGDPGDGGYTTIATLSVTTTKTNQVVQFHPISTSTGTGATVNKIFVVNGSAQLRLKRGATVVNARGHIAGLGGGREEVFMPSILDVVPTPGAYTYTIELFVGVASGGVGGWSAGSFRVVLL
jgi:hypothetical protein